MKRKQRNLKWMNHKMIQHRKLIYNKISKKRNNRL